MIVVNGTGSSEDPFLGEGRDEKGKCITFNASSADSPFLSPRQLLEASLAGCMFITIKRILLREKLPVDDLTVSVKLICENDHSDFQIEVQLCKSVDDGLKNKIIQEACQNSFVKKALTQSISLQIM